MIPFRHALATCFLVLFLAATLPLFAGDTAPKTPRRLANELDAMAKAGVKVIWSDELVPADLEVREEPKAKEPRKRLEEMLAPHGLGVVEGPDRSLRVVRLPPKKEAKPKAKKKEDDTQASGVAPGPKHSYMDGIVVTPGITSIGGDTAIRSLDISAAEVASLPHLADEPLRLIHRLPGVAAGDVSSRFYLRGGEPRGVGLLVDGLELDSAFHLEGLQGLFSAIAPEAIAQMDLWAGGYPAAYGDRLNGYLDLTPKQPSSRQLSLGLSFVTAQAMAGGRLGESGSWMVAARRGYLDVLLDFIDAGGDFQPAYADLYGQVSLPLGQRHFATVRVLALDDKEEFSDDDEDQLEGTQQGLDTWLALDSHWGSLSSGSNQHSLSSRFLLAAAESERERSGFITDDGLSQEIDSRTRRTETAKLELTREAGGFLSSVGLRGRRIEADYDHFHRRSRWVGPFEPYDVTTFAADFKLERDDLAAWITHRQKLGAHASAELGLRWQDDPFSNETYLSPRLAFTWAFEEGTILRASWGRYVQAMRVDELAVEDSDLRTYAAESADLAVISLERSLGQGIEGRLEVWDRRTRDPIPRYENLFDPIVLFPGLAGDRIRVAPEKSRGSGVDLYLKRSSGRVQGSFGYSWSRAEDLVRGRWEPRNWDQRHAATLELDFIPRKAWRFHGALTYHQGWPTTKLEVFETTGSNGQRTLVAGYRERNGERLGDYIRVDVRLSRSYERKSGDLELFFEVFNLLNRENDCCVERFDVIPQGNSYVLEPNIDSWLALVPSFGIAFRWR